MSVLFAWDWIIWVITPLYLSCYLRLRFNTKALTGQSPAVVTRFSFPCRMNTHAHVPYQVPGWEICLLSTNPQTRAVLDSSDDIQSPSRMYLKLQINVKEEKNVFFSFSLLDFNLFFPDWPAFFLHITCPIFLHHHIPVYMFVGIQPQKETHGADCTELKVEKWATMKGRWKTLG